MPTPDFLQPNRPDRQDRRDRPDRPNDQIDQTNQTNQTNQINQIDQSDQTAMKITRFEDLECWQEARTLTKMVYTVTKGREFQKDLRLSGQIQAAATSSMSNIAEGFIRRSDKELIQFLFIAMSSAAEVQSHLYVALDQEYLDKQQFDVIYEQANKTARIISGLITYLRTKRTKQTK